MNEFMKKAIELADDNLITKDGGPFGAVVVKDNKIIGYGSNRVLKSNDPTAHAEIEAIRNASKNINSYDLSECTLYTTCFPCPMCMSAIAWANIKKVYYGNTSIDAKNIGFRDDKIYKMFENNNLIELIQLDRDKTIKTFLKFKEKKDKEIY